jgi:hypothetical protein
LDVRKMDVGNEEREREREREREMKSEKKRLQKISVTPRYYLAEGPGFEPGLTGPEPVVLPLDDPSSIFKFYSV